MVLSFWPMQDLEQNQRETTLIGNTAIARYLGISCCTVWRWRHLHGFPAVPLPDGRIAVTTSLIDQWFASRAETLGRMNQSPGRPRQDKGKKQEVTSDTSSKGGQDTPGT